jgi:hypothetical protein
VYAFCAVLAMLGALASLGGKEKHSKKKKKN